MREPFSSLRPTAGSEKHLGVGVVESCRGFTLGVCGYSRILKRHKGGVQLTHIDSCTGFDNSELDEVFPLEHS